MNENLKDCVKKVTLEEANESVEILFSDIPICFNKAKLTQGVDLKRKQLRSRKAE